jgi:hypothetical protein
MRPSLPATAVDVIAAWPSDPNDVWGPIRRLRFVSGSWTAAHRTPSLESSVNVKDVRFGLQRDVSGSRSVAAWGFESVVS